MSNIQNFGENEGNLKSFKSFLNYWLMEETSDKYPRYYDKRVNYSEISETIQRNYSVLYREILRTLLIQESRIIVSDTMLFKKLLTTCVITFLIGLPMNLAILYLIIRRRKLHTTTNIFVSNVAVANVLSLLLMVVEVATFNHLRYFYWEFIGPTLSMCSGIATILSVTLLTVERAVALAVPVKHRILMTRKRIKLMLFFCWILSSIFMLMGFLRIPFKNRTFNTILLYVACISSFIAVVIVLLSFAVILFVALKSLNRKKSRTKNVLYKHQGKRNALLRELIVTGRVLLMVVPFATWWTYFIAIQIIDFELKIKFGQVQNFILFVGSWIMAALDPLLYLMSSRSIRLGFTEFMVRCFKPITDVSGCSL